MEGWQKERAATHDRTVHQAGAPGGPSATLQGRGAPVNCNEANGEKERRRAPRARHSTRQGGVREERIASTAPETISGLAPALGSLARPEQPIYFSSPSAVGRAVGQAVGRAEGLRTRKSFRISK